MSADAAETPAVASKAVRGSTRVTAGNTYLVTATDTNAALYFIVPQTGWYCFRVSDLKEIGVSSSKDKSRGYFLIQNKTDAKYAKEEDYEYLYYRPFKYVYCGKKLKYVEDKEYISFGTKAYCKSKANKKRDVYHYSYTICEGTKYLKKGQSYLLTTYLTNNAGKYRKGWTYKLRIEKN